MPQLPGRLRWEYQVGNSYSKTHHKAKKPNKIDKKFRHIKACKRSGRRSPGRQGTGCPARHSRGNPTGGSGMVWLAATLTQDGSRPKGSRRDQVRNIFSRGRVADPLQVTSRIAVGQDAFHIANFTANSTAWHCLEVRAISQGLCPKFL